VQHNNISLTPVGIDFGCNPDASVENNTIMDAGIGIAKLPAGFGSLNSNYNVQAVMDGCC
jgi:hypothetical protein